ncbi:MAG: alpha/beta hydrolase [Myxococcota bacterium]
MTSTDVHPQLREAWAKAPKLPYHKLERLPTMRRASAAMGKTSPVEGVSVRNVQTDETAVRVYTPGKPGGAAVLWMHGGGLLLGTPEQDDAVCSALARDLEAVVVSVRYRFAPEHPFPAAHDDCWSAWQWMQTQASAHGFDPGRVALAGTSAGGGLAATLAQRLRDEAEAQSAAVLLRWPMLDDRTAVNPAVEDTAHVVWNNRSNRAAWGAYLGQAAGAETVSPYAVAARHEDLHGLPPTWIGVGTLDLFHDEAVAYARRLALAEVPTSIEVVRGAFHDFTTLAPQAEISKACLGQQRAFLRRYLSAT